MPTKAEIKELVDNCYYEWTTLNGVKGGKFTSKKNGNSIFLPAAGGRWNGTPNNEGSDGHYWSGTLHEFYTYDAYGLHLNSGASYSGSRMRLYCGLTVRPVTD